MAIQINLKIHESLFNPAAKYAQQYGYRNIQDLIYESLREKIFNRYDDSFSKKEIEAIEKLLDYSIKNNKLVSEEELRKALHK